MRRLLGLLALTLATAVRADVPAEPIEDFVDREMPVSGTPGLAYAVIDGDRIETHTRGTTELGSGDRVTADTPFLLGSISKSFTALAVMQLVEAGKVDLDAPVARYLTAFEGAPAGKVTVRQLLSHTSGFSTLQGNASHAQGTGTKDELARRVDGIARLAPAYPAGTRWEYSNLNYQVLGRLIEVAGGEEYQAYVTAHILEPIGMTHSFVSDGGEHPAMASGHVPWFGGKRVLPGKRSGRGTAPQGGIVASAGDLALYLRTMMNGESDVLSAAGKAEMMRPASEASPFYGFGWFVDTGQHSVWHSGASPGFETLASMVPAERKGALALVNAGSGIGFGETTGLRSGITARALGLDYAGEGSRWSQKALFVALAVLPLLYFAAMAWAWRHRAAIRAKSGAFGLFSLWFPLLTTLVAAWALLGAVPAVIGAPLGTIRMFQPDVGLALIAGAVTGVSWALFRLGVGYSGRESAG